MGGYSAHFSSDNPPLNFKPIARVDFIVVHCSATREGHEFNAADIDRMHRQRGFKKIGYHYVIKLDGTVEKGRPDNEPGAHVEGYNSRSLGVCYIGGLEDKPGDIPKDTRTPAQIEALRTLLKRLTREHPKAEVLGHRDIPKVRKACPCFDVRPWWLTARK